MTKDERRKSIAAGIRCQRAKVGETQRELADGVEINPSTLSVWENNGGVSVEGAWKIADRYGISLDELVGRELA